ncbi:MAG: dephospho-CoA kinase [Candidatus Brocadiia bacterium]
MLIYPPVVDRTGRPLSRGIIVGVAGPIAGGKSTVGHFLAGLGAVVLDADSLGHRLIRMPDIAARLVDAFGDGILDQCGLPDRWKLGTICFQDADKLMRLNEILHPLIVGDMQKEVQEARRAGRMLVINAALLFETGMHEFCDYIILVMADERVREERAISKRGWPEGEMKRREAFQYPLWRKLQDSSYVIENNGSLEELRDAVEKVYKEIIDGQTLPNSTS